MKALWRVSALCAWALVMSGCDDGASDEAPNEPPSEAPGAGGLADEQPGAGGDSAGGDLFIVEPEPAEGPALVEAAPEGPPAAWSARYPAMAAGGQVEMHFTRPGTERGTEEDPEADDAIIAAIEGAQASVELCLYEFKRANIIDAVVDAIARGVTVRFVGDGDEIEDEGYEILAQEGLDLVVRRPGDRIMHNKFAVIDGQTVLTGSMNFSENGVMLNNNHLLRVESDALALAYQAEFQQMYDTASFGRRKEPLEIDQQLEIGDRDVEVYFSPQDRANEQLARLLATADHSVLFMVFSFTLTDIADDMADLHDQGVRVVGIFDESQGRGRYSVDERLAARGVPVFIDGNHNAIGFAGGKLHHKVMIIDAGTDSDPIVISGSYNWSNAASNYNDENLLVLHGQDFAIPFLEEFCKVLEVAEPHPDLQGALPDPCAELLTPVRINELLPNPDGPDLGEEFVEIINPGAAAMDLEGWTLSDALNVRHVFGPGDVLSPGGVMVIYGGEALDGSPRTVSSTGNLSLNNNADEITLRNPEGVVVDQIVYRSAISGIAFNRTPDGAGDGEVIRHDEVSPGGLPMSPGLRADGRLWPGTPRVVINELLPNPEGTDLGQEYVELINTGTGRVDLDGWRLGDLSSDARHVFEGLSLAPGEAVVIFDRGDHEGVPGGMNSSTGTLSLNNGGDTITLYDASGAVADQVVYDGDVVDEGVSVNRAVDGDIEAPMVSHPLADGANGPMSPGLRVSGADWVEPPPVLAVMINEVMPNPEGTDRGNEYVELVNIGEAEVDLGGWAFGDAVSASRHVFSGPELLPVGAAIVIFDGGEHPEVPNSIRASSGSLSLNNSDERLVLYRPDGSEMDAVTYTRSTEGVSLNRAIDGERKAVLIRHDEVEGAVGPTSPGLRSDGTAWGE